VGDAALDVRVGGIYALEQLAVASNDYRLATVEILTSYLREHDRWDPNTAPPLPPNDKTGESPAPTVRADLQAVMTVLGRRVQASSDPRLNLEEVNLRFMNLDGADLRRADLYRAHLEWAQLNNARLAGAYLGNAHLEGAILQGAHVEGADFINSHLNGAGLYSANLAEADFYNADLQEARFHGAHLKGARFIGADLKGADFRDADLGGVTGMTREQFATAGGIPKVMPNFDG
jgi:uncharacterized protein YjbI with pentapeptide repeats